MARAPLIDLVRRAYKVARLSNQSGVPPDELIEAQGYMEGGCETGEAAAQEILQALNLKSPILLPRSKASPT